MENKRVHHNLVPKEGKGPGNKVGYISLKSVETFFKLKKNNDEFKWKWKRKRTSFSPAGNKSKILVLSRMKIKKKFHSPRRGIEPRSPAWQTGILTCESRHSPMMWIQFFQVLVTKRKTWLKHTFTYAIMRIIRRKKRKDSHLQYSA